MMLVLMDGVQTVGANDDSATITKVSAVNSDSVVLEAVGFGGACG